MCYESNTKTEIKYAVQDTFGLAISDYDDLPKEDTLGGFEWAGSIENSGISLVMPLADVSISAASRILESAAFSHKCDGNPNLQSCIKNTLTPYAKQ